MKIILANPRGFCAGVNMAIESLERALELFGTPLYVFHEIVHNRHVVDRFTAQGVSFVNEMSEVPDGGMAIWARADDAIDVTAWTRAGEREGVMFSGSRDYDFFHRPQPFLRLGFTYHDESELHEAVRRMSRALARAGRTTAAAAAAAAGQRFAGHADTDPPTRKRPAGWA